MEKHKARFNNIHIILDEPRYPENIGAAARAMKNMGVPRLRVVSPRKWEEEKILKMATHEAADIVKETRIYPELIEAVSDLQYLIGTTARTGRKRRPGFTPRSIAKKIISLGSQIKIGIIFGSEKFGLNKEEINLCNEIVTIPTADFTSLNLAQSVMIMCYEIFMASIDESDFTFKSRPASVREREGMFHHLGEVCQAIGLYQKQTPEYWMTNARIFFNRKELSSRDVKMVRGFFRQILWAVKNAR